jgi:GT2 family glycosyltransferase
MQLSIIIVNYKTPGLVKDCIRSVFAHTKNIAVEIIVVDNNSFDNSYESVTSEFKDIRWIAMPYNSGFARANNEGIRNASGDVVLLLNSDTLAIDNSIEKVYNELILSEYVACGLQLLNVDGTPQISGSFFMRGGLNHLLPLPYFGKCLKWIADFFNVKKPHIAEAKDIVEVDWINGAFLMVKKSAIEKAGLLDEDFFLFAEEAEWCSRLKEVGRLCIYGQYSIVHLQGETANETFQSSGKGYYNLYDRKGLQIMVSNFLRIRKQFGVGWFLVQLFFYVLEVPILYLGIVLSTTFGKQNIGFGKAKGFLKNIFLLLKLSPTIVRNKPHFYKVL